MEIYMRILHLVVAVTLCAALNQQDILAQGAACSLDKLNPIALYPEMHRSKENGKVIIDSPVKHAYRLSDDSIILLAIFCRLKPLVLNNGVWLAYDRGLDSNYP